MRLDGLCVGVALIALVSCSGGTSQSAPIDTESVRAHYAKWNQLLAAGDIASAADLLAPDIWASVDHAPPIVGRDAAVADMKTWPKVNQTAELEEIDGGSDLVYTRASYTEHVTGADGTVSTGHVMCLDILQKTPTGWQFKRYSCHSIDPVPTALAAQKAPASVVSEFQALENAWARATQTKDPTALESILADEYYGFEVGFGQPESKRELIANTKASTVKWTSVTNTVRDVRQFGEMAVVRGEWAGIGTVDGKTLNARDSWMNVFIRRNGRWVSVASHDAPFPVPSKQ